MSYNALDFYTQVLDNGREVWLHNFADKFNNTAQVTCFVFSLTHSSKVSSEYSLSDILEENFYSSTMENPEFIKIYEENFPLNPIKHNEKGLVCFDDQLANNLSMMWDKLITDNISVKRIDINVEKYANALYDLYETEAIIFGLGLIAEELDPLKEAYNELTLLLDGNEPSLEITQISLNILSQATTEFEKYTSQIENAKIKLEINQQVIIMMTAGKVVFERF